MFGAVLLIVQTKWPLVKHRQSLKGRLFTNGIMASLTYVAAIFLVRPSVFYAMELSSNANWGILKLLPNNIIIQASAAFLLMDLSFYYWHRLNHKVNILWRFHNVHHIDRDMDVSTGFRFHFAEVALSSIFRFLQVLVIGPSLLIFLSYEFIFQMCTFFHHSNLRLPLALDNLLKWLVVTPRMHEIHHSNFKNETDSNYSVVFSFWDRIHKTFTKNVPMERVVIGVPGYSEPGDNSLNYLIISPFRKQKDYWRGQIQRLD
tara:strand:- start:357 stop:1136 length:780 start_codon:yes stop_codon:yes gene_type:complete